jgi:uncharacterized membrane protein YozB (DUF420 family)
MGIFDVNMPLLYGEGLKAFSRLQQEILKESTDQSLLAWDNFSGSVPDATSATTGAFADHPRRFKDAANIARFNPLALFDGKGTASTITNRGLEIYLPVLVKHDLDVTTKVEYTAILACHRAEDIARPLGISLQPVKGSRGRVFRRTASRLSLDPVREQDVKGAAMRRIHIQMNDQSVEHVARCGWIREKVRPDVDLTILDFFIIHGGPEHCWNVKTKTIPIPNFPIGSHGDLKMIVMMESYYRREEPEMLAIVISLDTSDCFSASVEIYMAPKGGAAYAGFLYDIRKRPLRFQRTAKVKCRQHWTAIARVGWEKILSREVLTVDIDVRKKSILPNSTQIFVTVFAIYFAALVLIGIKNEGVRQPRVRPLKVLATSSAIMHFFMFILPLAMNTPKAWQYWAPIAAAYFFLAFLYAIFPGVGRVLVLSALNGACLLYEFTKKIPSSEEFEGNPLGVLLHWLRHLKIGQITTVCIVVWMFVSSAMKTSSIFE